MRPCVFFSLFLSLLALVDGGLYLHHRAHAAQFAAEADVCRITVAGLGLSDLSLSTEARYTRHPAVSDLVVPFMDHPGAIEHFPTGSFWAPPSVWR
ncbi:MAG: hypothetical protein PHI06_00490 [Desulfobulbaceae bacterium]|nr:hypothetical protein [Desulfobulbaceae bacterium]